MQHPPETAPRVHIVGGGAREHAIAWTLARSPRTPVLSCSPGNAGIAAVATCVDIAVEDIDGIVAYAMANAVDLVVVGPEVALAAGLVDELAAVDIRAFGPSQLATRIESSKHFAKQLMQRAGVATASHRTFHRVDEAQEHIRTVGHDVVVKADGLAAGKGVVVPESLDEALEAAAELLALPGSQVVVEQRLRGPELSVLAFTDGTTVRAMPPARDHKRALDGDTGPNTGGMGAYSPVPGVDPAVLATIERDVLQPVVDELRAGGTPFVGVLYAGMMLTDDGPRVIEFNARFGDPEAQVILPRLQTDLLDVLEACAGGSLADVDVAWSASAAVTVVAAARAYPASGSRGAPIAGVGEDDEASVLFHAGTRLEDDQLVTAGGRVLSATGFGATVPEARVHAYARMRRIACPDLRHRTDIASAVSVTAD